MTSSHVDFNLDDLRVEQEGIDKLIESLLSFKAASTSNSLLQRCESENSASPVHGRGKGPGRPKSNKSSSTRTPSSPSPSLAEGSSLSTVIQCLNKLNVQNKRLFDYVGVLSENVKNTCKNQYFYQH